MENAMVLCDTMNAEDFSDARCLPETLALMPLDGDAAAAVRGFDGFPSPFLASSDDDDDDLDEDDDFDDMEDDFDDDFDDEEFEDEDDDYEDEDDDFDYEEDVEYDDFDK
jgi:hypothetical protein